MAFVLPAIATMLGKDMALILKVQECPEVMVATQDNASTLTSVATIGTAIRVVLHMAQVHRPSPTLARAAHNLYVVNEVGFHL